MERKFFKAVLALTLSAVLALGGATAAFAADQTDPDGSVGGGSTVNTVPIRVTVPTQLDFALDPLELNVIDGSQIATTDYVIVNKTAAPVKVTFDLEAVLETDVALVDDATTLEKDDDTVKDKALYFAILGADSLDENDLAFDGTGSVKATYDATKDTLVPFNASSKEASIVFALDAATEAGFVATSGTTLPDPDTLAAGTDGIASFQFYGEMNTYAAWATDDVKVTGTFTLTPLRATTFANYTTDGAYTTDGVNQLAAGAKANVTIAEGGTATFTGTKAAATAAGGVTAMLTGKPESVTEVKLMSNSWVYTATTDYTYNKDTGVFTQKLLPSASSASIQITAGGKTYTLKLELS